MIKKLLVVGGASGIGLSIAREVALRDDTEKVYVVDKNPFQEQYMLPKIESYVFDLTNEDYSFFNRFSDINSLMITAGFGRLSLFKDVPESYITQSFSVNTVPPIRLIKRFYDRLEGKSDFYCGVMVSIAGWMSSPFYAVYGASKAALKIFIESVNVELRKAGTTNQILDVSPGSIKGTSFSNGQTDLSLLTGLTKEIIAHLESKSDVFIPQYEDVYKHVLERYYDDFRKEGEHSYEYKLGRMLAKKS